MARCGLALSLIIIFSCWISPTLSVRQVKKPPVDGSNSEIRPIIYPNIIDEQPDYLEDENWVVQVNHDESVENFPWNINKVKDSKKKGELDSVAQSQNDFSDIKRMQKEILLKLDDLTSKVDKIELKLTTKVQKNQSPKFSFKSDKDENYQMVKHLNSVKTEFVSKSTLDQELYSSVGNPVDDAQEGLPTDDVENDDLPSNKVSIDESIVENKKPHELNSDSQIGDIETNSAIGEILSLVRWLVRKKLTTEQVQSSLFGGLLHTLQARQNLFQNSILQALTSKTQHLINHTDTLKESMSDLIENNYENTKLIVNKLSEVIPSLQNPTVRSSTENNNKLTSDIDEIDASFESGIPSPLEGLDIKKNSSESQPVGLVNGFLSMFTDYDFIPESLGDKENKSEYLISPPASIVAILPKLFESNDTEAEKGEPINQVDDELNVLTVSMPIGDIFLNPDNIRGDLLNDVKNSSVVLSIDNTLTTTSPIEKLEIHSSEAVDNRTELATLLEKWRRELNVMLDKDNVEDNADEAMSAKLQEMQDSILGLKFYFDSGMLRLRNQLEATIATSEFSIVTSLADALKNATRHLTNGPYLTILTDALDSAVSKAQNTALRIADAAVTSVSSAAVASSKHNGDRINKLIRKTATHLQRLITQSAGSCPDPYKKIGDMCLVVPILPSPVPFTPLPSDPQSLSEADDSTTSAPVEDDLNFMTYTQAQTTCRSYNGNMLVLGSEHQLNPLKLSLRNAENGSFWLGPTQSPLSDSSDNLITFLSNSNGGTDFKQSDRYNLNGKSKPRCLVLMSEDGFRIAAEDCNAKHRPLCRYLPSLL